MNVNEFIYKIVAVLVLILVLSGVACSLWNWIAPVFGFPTLSIYQFLGVVLFVRVMRSLLFDEINVNSQLPIDNNR